MSERQSVGASVPDQALAVPATPLRVDGPAGFDPSRGSPCPMGVGCDEAGVCYAAANGEPERCPRDPEGRALEWLYTYSQRAHGEDPEDIDFSADQMVDAYLAGAASGIETRQGGNEVPSRSDDSPARRETPNE